ncbi:uncharacterized protein LOC123212741 [Mangifera indica]|uniref:uncharacterized protein LOC123212741 n=1 Tax=Mangifera indica TaxID=29780 RepID=UPI001CFC1BED|nr:uncharacterized protein LOC123212741 [Mangifera indica]
MEEYSGEDFPGFQIGVHKEEYVFKRPLSRLQRRAPCPLKLIKPINNASSAESNGASKAMGCSLNSSSSPTPQSSLSSSSSSSSSSFGSFHQSKDPIPLLSPLVLPSMLESSLTQEGNTAKSH